MFSFHVFMESTYLVCKGLKSPNQDQGSTDSWYEQAAPVVSRSTFTPQPTAKQSLLLSQQGHTAEHYQGGSEKRGVACPICLMFLIALF